MKDSLGSRLMAAADLPGESFPGVPLIEIAGDKRILIEHHNGVIQYGSENIRLKVKYGQVCISGELLKLSHMTKGQLVISGQIDSVHIIRGC
jgi:sporulation protein YqfC